MVKTKKLIIFLMLVSCFFIVISSASAADLHVKDKTTHKDITNWMKNAKTGNNLIFDGSSYNLTDTVKINKAINVKSSKNTKINFNKNKPMFKITTSSKVTFSGLTLNYKGHGTNKSGIGIISSSQGVKKANFNKVNINSSGNYVAGIEILAWEGSVSKSKINVNGAWGIGISSTQWKGNLVNSYVSVKGACSIAVYSTYWMGKVSGSKIYNKGPDGNPKPIGAMFVFAKGTISKCKIETPNGWALRLDKNVKVTGCTLKSSKELPKIYRFVPDLCLSQYYFKKSGKTYSQYNITRSGNTYSITVSNSGLATSKACYLGIKIGSYVKTVKVKALNPTESTIVKVTIPAKYISNKYVKTIKLDYYNKVKGEDKNNNILQSKTPEKEIQEINTGL